MAYKQDRSRSWFRKVEAKMPTMNLDKVTVLMVSETIRKLYAHKSTPAQRKAMLFRFGS